MNVIEWFVCLLHKDSDEYLINEEQQKHTWILIHKALYRKENHHDN